MSLVGRVRVGPEQMKKILDLLSEDGVLKDGKVTYEDTNRKNFWKRIATQLNNVDGGVYKNPLQWCKMWADWKTKTKKKANILLRRSKCTVEQKTLKLTDLELRLLKLINYPFDNNMDTLRLDRSDKTDEADNAASELQSLDFLTTGDFIVIGEEKMSSNDETKYCNENNDSHFCSVDDVLQDDNDEECSSGTERNEKVKIKGQSYKRKKISLEAYKIKTTMALEKEKVQQRTEELRLRALELKVKRDELRLKEMEMNKINYLTNIEEEKLKCLRDISSSLKELLDRNKSGNFRFSNIL